MSELFAALAAFKLEPVTVPKSKTVTVVTKTGGRYSYDYAPLDQIQKILDPILAKHGLAVIQPIVERDGKAFVKTMLVHSGGDCVESIMELPDAPDEKALGSAITYRRRYAYCAILGISTEEDTDVVEENDTRVTRHSTPKPAPKPAPKPEANTISDAQIKRLFAVTGEKALTNEQAKEIISAFGFASSRDITKDKYEEVVAAIQNA